MTLQPSLLVVDDSDIERRLMAATLSQAFPKADVDHAAHPLEAKAKCEARIFDCVLMDYNMPGMDGLALARELKTIQSYLPTVLMTSYGDEMLAAEALRTGVSDYMPKSRMTADSLERAVTRSIHACAQARLIDEQRDELENFAHALAHDFKQPIRQITTFSDLISEGLGANGDPDVLKHLKFLTDAAARLANLVDVMSQYTLLNRTPPLKDVDLAKILDGIRASLASYVEERQGEIITLGDLPTVRGDETLMTQVLQNLIVNGLHYNKSATPRIEVSAAKADGEWTISVKDNGIGIEDSFMSSIFDPLVRLHNATDYSGTGLGLTLARKAAHTQGGSISCASTLGAGSSFFVRLPAAGGKPQRHPSRNTS